MIYPYQSSKSALRLAVRNGTIYINRHLTPTEKIKLKVLNQRFSRGDTSLRQNSSHGKLNPARRNFHNRIIRNQFADKRSIDKKDPDLYIFGGLPASGKTTALASKVPEKTIVIDSDFYKQSLSKKTKPGIKRYPLANASYFHDESDILVSKAVNKSIKEKRDVTYDATFKTYNKGKAIIDRYKKEGYDIHYLGTQKRPSRSIIHAAKRFIKTGRFVPLSYISTFGNQISANAWKARKLGDTYQIWDTNSKKNRLVTKSRKPMSFNFRNP